jgi:Lrp/AsnC family transcriptional regulator, leucine-responsive regulatory protein
MAFRRPTNQGTFKLKSNTTKVLQSGNTVLDARNVELIRLLQINPRANISELARRIGMSAPSVRERLTRLEETGVIRGYSLELDASALGWPITAFVRIRPMAGQFAKVTELAVSMAQVAECHRITGEDCLILKIYLKTLESLDGVLDRFLAYGQTTTSLVQSSPVPLRAPPLPLKNQRLQSRQRSGPEPVLRPTRRRSG